MSRNSLLTGLLALITATTLAACASGSRYQGLDADGVYEMARASFEEGDYGDAAEALERLLLAFPTFQDAPEATLLLARARFLDEQYITAASDFARFLDRYPAHTRAPEAALGVCRSYAELSPIPQRDQTYTEQALAVCSNVLTDYRGTDVVDEAALIAADMQTKLARKVYENGSYYMRRQFHDSAIIYFEELLENYPNTEWAPKALAGIIEAYGEIGYDDEVEEARNQLLTRYPDSPEARALEAGGGDGRGGS